MRNGHLSACDTLDALVISLCADFRRRSEIISLGNAEKRTLSELAYLNLKIQKASAEIAGDSCADIYITEIGEGVGYAKSLDEYVSETTYKKYKKAIKENIARALYLT